MPTGAGRAGQHHYQLWCVLPRTATPFSPFLVGPWSPCILWGSSSFLSRTLLYVSNNIEQHGWRTLHRFSVSSLPFNNQTWHRTQQGVSFCVRSNHSFWTRALTFSLVPLIAARIVAVARDDAYANSAARIGARRSGDRVHARRGWACCTYGAGRVTRAFCVHARFAPHAALRTALHFTCAFFSRLRCLPRLPATAPHPPHCARARPAAPPRMPCALHTLQQLHLCRTSLPSGLVREHRQNHQLGRLESLRWTTWTGQHGLIPTMATNRQFCPSTWTPTPDRTPDLWTLRHVPAASQHF